MGDVRVLSVSRVAPSQQHGGRVKLSYLEAALPAVQPLFLYDLGDSDRGFPAVVSRLKAALAATLTRYPPWAGRLEYEAETGDMVVDYSDGGVAFVVAEAGHGYDMPALVSLVPELDAAAVLSVQVTRLGARGLAVGLSMHHAVEIGEVFRFMEAWASSTRDAVHHHRPRVITKNHASQSQLQVFDRLRLARATFHLRADDIRFLKRRIDHLAATAAPIGTPEPKPVSTLVALAALGWTAFVRSKGLGLGAHLLSYAYLGNCLRCCADASDIASGEAGIVHAARALQAAQMESAPQLDQELSNSNINIAPSFNVTGFRLYDKTDFGFGKPARVEMVSMNHDGEMFLLGGRREGEVQLSVSIHPAHVHTFKACVLSYIPISSRIQI